MQRVADVFQQFCVLVYIFCSFILYFEIYNKCTNFYFVSVLSSARRTAHNFIQFPSDPFALLFVV